MVDSSMVYLTTFLWMVTQTSSGTRPVEVHGSVMSLEDYLYRKDGLINKRQKNQSSYLNEMKTVSEHANISLLHSWKCNKIFILLNYLEYKKGYHPEKETNSNFLHKFAHFYRELVCPYNVFINYKFSKFIAWFEGGYTSNLYQ